MVKGIRKALVSGFVACLVLATTLTAQAAVGRPFAGADRFETANKVLADGWTKADTAIIVEGYHYADALAVAPLASKENAPLIFLQNGDKAMMDKAMTKLNDLGVKKVYIATGTGVLGTYVEDALKTNKNITTVERLGGVDRYETSAKIAAKVGTSSGVAIVTGSDVYADAVSIAPIAALKGMPILFADKDTLRDSIKSAVKASGATSAYIIGGEGAIAKNVEALLPNPTRLSGVDRYETNYKVIDAFKGDLKFEKVYVASGQECADALAVSALAAKSSSPIILADWELNTQAADLLKAKMTKDTDIRIVGGTGRVLAAVETKVDEIQKAISTPVEVKTGKANVTVSFNDNFASIKSIKVESAVAGAKKFQMEGSSVVKNLGETATVNTKATALKVTLFAEDGKTVVATGNVDVTVKTAQEVEVTLSDVVVTPEPTAEGTADVTVSFNDNFASIKSIKVNSTVAGAKKFQIEGSSVVKTLGETATVNTKATSLKVTLFAEDGTTIVATGAIDVTVKTAQSVKLEVVKTEEPTTPATPEEKTANITVSFNDNFASIKSIKVETTVATAKKFQIEGSSVVKNVGETATVNTKATSLKVTFFAADGTTVVATGNIDVTVKTVQNIKLQ